MVLLHYSQIMVFVIIEVSNKQAVFLVIPLIEKIFEEFKVCCIFEINFTDFITYIFLFLSLIINENCSRGKVGMRHAP